MFDDKSNLEMLALVEEISEKHRKLWNLIPKTNEAKEALKCLFRVSLNMRNFCAEMEVLSGEE